MSEDLRQRAVEYLVGEMSPDQEAEFERELDSDGELARTVDQMRPVVSRLEGLPDEAWQLPEPPPLVLPAELSGEPGRSSDDAESAHPVRKGPEYPDVSGPAAERLDSGPRPPGRGWRLGGFAIPRVAAGVAAAAALLMIGFFVGNRAGDDQAAPGSEPVRTVALDSLGPAPGNASGEIDLTSSAEDPVTLTVDGLQPSPSDEFYELWLLGDDGELIALGSFKVGDSGASEIKVPLPVDPGGYRYFDVSIQPENGSPDHSGRSVLRGLTNS